MWSRELPIHLFSARYSDGKTIQVCVNREHFPVYTDAHRWSELFSDMLGRMPQALRKCLDVLEVHDTGGFGAANQTGTRTRIHADASYWDEDQDADRGWHARSYVEEIVVHELGHTCERTVYGDPGTVSKWREAVRADGAFISDYAELHPLREDMAESVLSWLAVRYRWERVDQEYIDTVHNTIPNRLAWFDEHIAPWHMGPVDQPTDTRIMVMFFNPASNRSKQSFLRIVNPNPMAVSIKITATDDAGISRTTEIDIVAMGATMYSSDKLEDAVGDGQGKWWLVLESEHPIHVRNLLRTPEGVFSVMP